MHNPQNASPPNRNVDGLVGIELAPRRIVLLRLISVFLSVTTAFAICSGQTKKRSAIQWNRFDCTSPLMLPDGFYDLSQFGKGQYRIDGKMSVGHFNNIYMIFQAKAALDPEVVSGATESTFMVKDRKVMWRSYKTVVEGRSVIRKEALMPNILPHEKGGNSSDCIWIRMDADSQQILDELTPAAEEILRDCAEGKAEAVISRWPVHRERSRSRPLRALWAMALWWRESM